MTTKMRELNLPGYTKIILL